MVVIKNAIWRIAAIISNEFKTFRKKRLNTTGKRINVYIIIAVCQLFRSTFGWLNLITA
jgi:hypothetical protein